MQETRPKHKNRILAVVGVVVVIVAVVLAVFWASGTFNVAAPHVVLVNYDCYANPIIIATVAHWEGDLRNTGTAPGNPTVDMYIDGAVVRTRTYEIAAGGTFHFIEDYQRAGQDTNSHTCEVRLR